MWENSEYRVKISDNTVMEYEKVVLTSGSCNLFMPMGFLGAEDGEIVCYDCSGYAPLSNYEIEKTEDALFILEQTLMILNKATDYLITPSKITVTRDTVFYNIETGEIKIAYIPNKQDTPMMRRNIVAFIKELQEDVCDGKEKYLTETARYVLYNNYYFKDIVNKVALFRREIYMEGVAN